MKGVCLVQVGNFAVKVQVLVEKGTLEGLKKEAAKETRENTDGKKESVRGRDPLGPIGRDPTRRYDAMEVGMEEEVLPPSVENGKKADFGTEVFGVGGEGE